MHPDHEFFKAASLNLKTVAELVHAGFVAVRRDELRQTFGDDVHESRERAWGASRTHPA